jgi:hypothetical protein
MRFALNNNNSENESLKAAGQESLKTIWPVVAMALRIDTRLPVLR